MLKDQSSISLTQQQTKLAHTPRQGHCNLHRISGAACCRTARQHTTSHHCRLPIKTLRVEVNVAVNWLAERHGEFLSIYVTVMVMK
jgi:hypothetical protein